jgi:hypothetical protein
VRLGAHSEPVASQGQICPQGMGLFHSFLQSYPQIVGSGLGTRGPVEDTSETMKGQEDSYRPERHRRQTQVRLVGGGLLILLVVGGALVWVIYGGAAAVTAILCLLASIGLFGLLWLILTLLERWVKEDEA